MVNHSLFQRTLMLSFLFILFFTNVGYTATDTEQLSSTDAAQQSTSPSAGTPADASTDQTAAPVIAAVETSTGDNSLTSLLFPSVAAEPNTGAATAAIQIEVPPGRKGIQPSLTLQYNSNGENGWVGVGWDVPGSFIKRNTKYGVNYTANDFVHDSAELIERPDWGGNCFGRKIEGAFSKYYFNATTGGWEVTSKNGTKYYYGTTSASRQDNTYGVFKWMLDKVLDTNGNYMTISYWKDQGEIYLDRIDYTGSSNLSPTNYVKFYCETRTDAPPLYTSNVAVKTAYRLKTIDVVANGSRVRAYKLNYTTSASTWQSILASIQQYGTDAALDASGTVTGGSALPPVGLDYSSMSSSISWGLWSNPVFGDVMSKIRVGDLNGDGKSDLYFFANNTNIVGISTGTSFLWYDWGYSGFGDVGNLIRIGDFNGDGKSDPYFFANNTNIVGISTGASVNWQQWGTNGFGDIGSRIRVGDFNGDGKSDLYFRTGDNNDWVGLADPTAISQVPDRLNTVSNGLGGATTIQYKPSSSYTNTLLPFITQTVSSITVNDGNGIVSTTNYTYSGGLYDIPDREFRGFQYVKATDPAGATSENWFNQDDIFKGLPYDLVTKDPAGNIYHWTYNAFQSLSPYTGVNFPSLLQKDEYLYDGTTTWKQTSTSFTYDAYGNITRKYFYGDTAISGDEMDEYTTYNYDTANWILSLPTYTYVCDSNGVNQAKTWFTYDTSGNLLTVKKWLQGGSDPITTYTYYNNGNCKSITDPMGNGTTITYDGTKTYPYQTTNPLGQITTTVYDQKFGKITSATDIYGNTTTYEYDVFGRSSKVTNPYDGSSAYGTISYWYQNFGVVGNQKVVTYHTEQSGTANVLWNEAYFDGLGRTIKTRKEGPDAKVIVADTTYNQSGLAATKSLPYFEGIETPRKVTFEYDPIGRITRTTNPDNTFTQTIYRKGRTTFIDANSHKKLEEKDAYGRLVSVEEYTGSGPYTLYAVTTYQYDVLGNLLNTKDALNNQTTMVYDTLGRKTSMSEPNMGTWAYTYDLNGNLKTQTDAKGQAIQFFYDGLNRITLKDYPTGTDVTYAYDDIAPGGITTMTDGSGITKSYYDKIGRVTKVINTVDSVNYTTETTYDALGRTTSIKYPDNETVNYTYDAGGNLSQVTGYATYTNHNALGQAQGVVYGNGVTTTYQYDSTNNRLSSIITTKTTDPGSLAYINRTYTYDNGGNVKKIKDFINNSRTQTFVYDELNRLVQAQSTISGTLAYSYNQIGNILSKEGITYAYGGKPHAVSSTSDGKTYTYDANGNMINDTQRAILYNYDNMPTYINYNGATTQLVYDGQGNRVKKIAGTTNTAYIGRFYEVVNSGQSYSKYIFAGNTRLALKNASVTRYYHQDHLGSSNVITNASGNNVEEIQYLPYGNAWSDTNATLTTHKFTGQELDAETGLYYYGARYYNPQLGRFISADSIVPDPANPQAQNRYSYVINNPLLYTDPTGHFFGNVIIGAVVGAIIGGTTAAVTGGNIKQGIIAGAITGAFMGVGGGIISGAAESGYALSSVTQAGIYTAAGTTAGATNASIYGANIGQGALFGGAFGLAGYCVPVPNFTPLGGSAYASAANRVFNAGLTGAAFGAAYTGMTGGDVGQGAMMGALAWAAGEGVNMGIGHGIGYAMSGKAPSFSNGAFYYYSEGQTPFTVGGAIIGDKRMIEGYNIVNNQWDYNHTVDQHEQSHFPQQTALSVSYVPVHLASQGVGGAIGVFTGVGFGAGTHRYNIFERGWIDVPSY